MYMGEKDIYFFGGPGKTGGSAMSSMLAANYGLQRYYSGGYMRTEALKANFAVAGYDIPQDINAWDLDKADIVGFRLACDDQNRPIDEETDLYLHGIIVSAVLEGRSVVIDSKIAARLVHTDAYLKLLAKIISLYPAPTPSPEELQRLIIARMRAVWVHARGEVRAIRSVKKGAIGTPIPELVERELASLTKRQLQDGDMYLRYYGIEDFPTIDRAPGPNYGVLIDNSDHPSLDYTYAQVVKALGL